MRTGQTARTIATGIATAALLAFASSGVAQAQEAAPAAQASPKFEVGRSYTGQNGYIEYVPGDAPIILTAPHGGRLAPASIPDRSEKTCGGVRAVTVTDTNTAELVMAMREAFHERYGVYPHVVISRLSRKKLDPNRPLADAACGNAEAALAFREWHAFINAAKKQVLETSGRGWYMDMHGHGHQIQRLELGYLLNAEVLNESDAKQDANKAARDRISIRTLMDKNPTVSLSEFLSGPNSIGTLYDREGFPSVPSQSDPRPRDEKYFNGGYNTRRHTCGDEASPLGGTTAGPICGLQIETNWKGVRDTPASHKRFGEATAKVLGEYLETYWGLKFVPVTK